VLAGVAGGLAEYTGVDPVVFRVLFAVLTLFGGAGLLLYLVGWLFLPDEGQRYSAAESLVGRGRSGSSTAEAALLAGAAFVLGILLIRGDAGDLALLAVVVIGIVLIVRKIDERRRQEPGPSWAGPPYPPPGEAPPYRAAEPAGASWVSAGGPGEPLATASTTTGVLPPSPYGYPPPQPAPPRPRRARSVLGLLTLSAMLVALGVLAALDVSGVLDPAARHYLALALAVLGAGLLAGAWLGRARWLIAVGIPLTLALVAASTAQDTFRGGTGERLVHPITSTDVQPRYELGAGSLDLDLSDVDFTEQSGRTTVHLGAGNVSIVVPRNVDVTVHAGAGVGSLDLLGSHYDGVGLDRSFADEGPDGSGGGDLDLTVEVGLGHVEVDRVAS
jgi:phage shock protein PspC (stress-responsive transcriptional regulator)